MKRGAPELNPELDSLLRFRTVTRRLPDDVRARVLARSQPFVSAFASARRPISRVAPFAGPKPSAPTISRRGRLGRLAIAASIAIVAGAAGAVAALRSRAAGAPPAVFPESSVSSAALVPEGTVPEPEPDPVNTKPTTATHHTMTSKPRQALKARGTDPLAEVELLQHAHLAYARRDFRGALAVVAEHARHFPNGPLAEECEALRVESLVAAGYPVEAKRASAAFAARFPRSVLLLSIEQTAHKEPAP